MLTILSVPGNDAPFLVPFIALISPLKAVKGGLCPELTSGPETVEWRIILIAAICTRLPPRGNGHYSRLLLLIKSNIGALFFHYCYYYDLPYRRWSSSSSVKRFLFPSGQSCHSLVLSVFLKTYPVEERQYNSFRRSMRICKGEVEN